MRKLFGTDGIRAVAGEAPLDRKTIYAIGLALAHSLRKQAAAPRVVFGMDTRESGHWIAATLTQGLHDGGVEAENAGVIPTPGIAFLTRTHGFFAGIVISASHNPWQDNGIKVFGADGYKLADSVELNIEAEIFERLANATEPSGVADSLPPVNPTFRNDYIQFLQSNVPELRLDGKTIVMDCANGAASAIAPQLFAQMGGNLVLTHCDPNGRNINEDCGALHPEIVAREVVASQADLGMTFDGDADRALFADAHGNVVNGDAVLLIAARDLQARGLLHSDLVVATTMSNMGLEAALGRNKIRMLRAPVGDKYVLEEMRRSHAVLGGEQSGHILFTDRSTTGDGLLTALVMLDILHRAKQSLAALKQDLKVFPQVIVNVRVREKKPLEAIPSVARSISEAEEELHGNGRVVVRYSGTEALARVMIEAESNEVMERHATRIADAIRDEIGV
ncbi:MAG TPA: phosphoglucosamine mutase [Acidobacteriaceae bacterium]|jgi:phosphoglucosamine mutase|nr:phosphoglucosamine mutase [Acidobacteriaceae bacterium]